MNVLKPGRNCLRRAAAKRVAVIVDAANYYARLEQALLCSTRSILILGWDFDGRIKLCPHLANCMPLGPFLRSLVEERHDLEIRVLVWSGAVVHAPGDPMSLLLGASWQDHPRITLRLDGHHPLYASHHQKLVVIDDSIAFVGGIDLTVERWDRCSHAESDRFRSTPDGHVYRPVHDLQMVVEGDAAAAIGDVARERWRVATGRTLEATKMRSDLWPRDLKADFTDTAVGIARTIPGWGQTAFVGEIATLTEDILAAARHSIYIKAQYFTSSKVRQFLSRTLAATHGPEVVILVRKSSPGKLERVVMGANRDRVMRHIRRADRHNRLRFYYPVVAGKERACEVLVHSKLVIIDDRILRIGSSNLNNRSMGLDTECDLVIEAFDSQQRHAISELRDRLLAEHLAVSVDRISAAIAENGSLIRGIEQCNRNDRGLRPFAETDLDGPVEPIFGTHILDPKRPL
ncbi:phospholipase D-like domain-containing protein [Xanthobacteraceae bacterium Astr-EGSB]|uniref:phospholipase D-like domain-containing protein n=1 Tax=Astrobacterium formosum TaxID=3069710 RepID=UPI0027AF231A|nr:phospholipase D-like domain-containing protein [Xanthobacteraceae bacterium Astr-EGSB]